MLAQFLKREFCGFKPECVAMTTPRPLRRPTSLPDPLPRRRAAAFLRGKRQMNGRRGIAGCGVRRDAVAKAECGAPTAITAPRAPACPLRPLFAAALLALSAALALPAAAQTTDPVWSATMTAGDTRVGHGYDATDTPDTPAIGALDDDDFDYGSLPYRVLAIDVATNVVRFAVEPGGQLADETLTLEFGGHALAFSDRISAISFGQNIYWNVPAALDDLETEFPVGSTATVCLRTATQVCPTGSIVTPPMDANAAPSFSSSATFNAAENQTAAGTVLATDSDSEDDVTGYAITGGADQNLFSIGATSGALTFDAAPNFEDAKDTDTGNDYVVEVQATSGAGERVKTATQTITVTVTDVSGEAPGKPDAPTVAPASVSSLTVNWSAPSNAGPAIRDYDVQYREGTSGSWSDGGHTGAATTATLSGLSENTSYQVQVRATSDEGTGSWSDSGSGTTDVTTTPTVTLALSDDSIGEDGGVSTVTATVSPASAAAFTVTVAAAAVSPAVAADFRLSANQVLSFAENATASTGSVTITGVDNDVDAADKTVTVSGTVSAASVTAPANRTLTLNDDDLPVVTIARDKNVVNEDEGDAGFTLTRVGVTAGTLAVTVEVTQQADRDLLPDGAEAMRTVTFAAGSATAALAVALENDDLNEVISDLTVEVQPGTGYTVGDPASATVSVVDTDKTTATPANLVASPGAGVGEVTLAWDTHALHLQFVRHQYRYKTDGAYGDWTDIPNSGQHSIGEGDGSNLTGYTVTGLVGGQAHTFEVRTAIPPAGGNPGIFSDSSNEYSATPRSAAVSFEAATYSVDEGATVEVTVSLSGAPGREVTVAVTATAAGGATAQGETGADWSGVPENVTFGATDTEQSFTLAATDDTDADAGESVTLSFGTLPDGVTAGSPAQATVAIVNDDQPTVTVADGTATEGDKVEFTVTLSALSGLDVEVDYATTETDPQSAVSGTDFTAASGTLEIEAGNRTGTIEVQTTEDDASESAETFTLTISNPDNATLGAKVAATGTINDDDAAGVRVSATALTVTEQDAAGDSYTVVLDTEPTHEVTVAVGGHAGTDVRLSASTLTFTTSNWDQAQTVTVTALNDDDTANDAVTLTHTATSTDGNYSGIAIAGVSVTVTDNDTTTPAVTLVLSDASIGENGGVSTVTATVSPASAAAFTVTVAAAAVAPAVATDFELSTNRVLSFAENATTSTGTVTITGVDNDVDAADKTVTVSGTVSATSVTAPANRTLTLEDDDPLTVGISNSRGDEHYVPGVAGVAIGPYVQMSAVSDKIVIVTWTASIESGDTAEEADFVDLSAVTGTVWLVPGWKVHAFNLPPVVFDDALDEEDETFTVTLSAVNAVVGQVNASVHSAGTMTIVDDGGRRERERRDLHADDLEPG